MRQDNLILADIHPRNSETIELQVLKDLTEDDDLVAEVINVIRPEHFTTEGRRTFWNNIVSHFNAGDAAVGYRAFAEADEDTKAEFLAFRELDNTSSIKDQALSHIAILRDEAARRRAYNAGLAILQLSTGGYSENEIYIRASEAVQGIEDTAVKEEYTIREVFNEIAEEVQQRKALHDAGKKTCIGTGFPNLDNTIDGGFKRGNLIVIAARPGVGKTALSIQLVRNAAEEGNKTVFFSIEMMRDEIGNRMLYSTERVNSYQVWTGNMDWPQFEAAVKGMEGLPILLNDRSRNLSELVSRMTVLARRGKCDIAFVDYLGLIDTADKRIPLYQQIAEVTSTMKVTAKRLGIPIVLLCQLNRDAAKDEIDPDLYHLRDSGSIEQDADIVLMLRRNQDNLDVLIRKNRHGEANLRVTLGTNSTRTNYHEISIEKI